MLNKEHGEVRYSFFSIFKLREICMKTVYFSISTFSFLFLLKIWVLFSFYIEIIIDSQVLANIEQGGFTYPLLSFCQRLYLT